MPKLDKHPRPRSGLVGWPSAWSVLDKIDDDDVRNLLGDLCRNAGVQGPHALKLLAAMLRWYANGGDYPSAPKALKPAEVTLVEARAREALAPYVGDPRFPRLRGVLDVAERAA